MMVETHPTPDYTRLELVLAKSTARKGRDSNNITTTSLACSQLSCSFKWKRTHDSLLPEHCGSERTNRDNKKSEYGTTHAT